MKLPIPDEEFFFLALGAALAFVMSMLRATFSMPFWARVSNALICSLLSLGVMEVLTYYGVPMKISVWSSVFVSYMGASYLGHVLRLIVKTVIGRLAVKEHA